MELTGSEAVRLHVCWEHTRAPREPMRRVARRVRQRRGGAAWARGFVGFGKEGAGSLGLEFEKKGAGAR